MRDLTFRCSVPFMVSAGLLLIGTGCGARSVSNSGTNSEESKEIPALAFNGDSALNLIRAQVEMGPRVPGSMAHALAGDWLVETFRRCGATVHTQKTRLATFDNITIPMTNILASLKPEAEKRMMIVAHWDTRPWADQDPDPMLRNKPVDGANDGASGTSVCLELARILSDNPELKNGVDFLLVDAEDWGADGIEDSWAMGARYFVNNPPDSIWKFPEGVIVVDMVGDKNATFHPEYFSEQSAPGLNRRIWSIAKELGYGNYFIDKPGGAITDDHVPFIEIGIPAVDIVDFRQSGNEGFPPQWHTTSDKPDLISPKTLEAVGRTLEYLLLTF